MPRSFAGGCACGAIRYACMAEPIVTWRCHCRDCQRAGGGGYFPGLYVPKVALKIDGEPRYYESRADSGNHISRGFCPNCGSPLFVRPDLVPDLVGLWAASLDDPSWYSPKIELWTVSANPWDRLDPDLTHCEQNPTAEIVERLLKPPPR